MPAELGVVRQVGVGGVSEREEAARLGVPPEDLEEDAHAAPGHVVRQSAPRSLDQHHLVGEWCPVQLLITDSGIWRELVQRFETRNILLMALEICLCL